LQKYKKYARIKKSINVEELQKLATEK
jgi:hypothetical protein